MYMYSSSMDRETTTQTEAENGEKTMAALHDYETGESIRQATEKEEAESVEAAEHDGGAGVIDVNGRRCYVQD